MKTLEKEVVAARLQGSLDLALEKARALEAQVCSSVGESSIEKYGARLLKQAKEERKQSEEWVEEVLKAAWIADALGNIGKMTKVDDNPVTLLELALDLRREALARDPESEQKRLLVARSLSALAMLYHAKNLESKADEAHLEALNIFSQVPLKAAKEEETESSEPPTPMESAPCTSPVNARNGQEGSKATLVESPSGGKTKENTQNEDNLMDWKAFMEKRLREVEESIKTSILNATLSKVVEREGESEKTGETTRRQRTRLGNEDGFPKGNASLVGSFQLMDMQELGRSSSEFQARLILVRPSETGQDIVTPFDVQDEDEEPTAASFEGNDARALQVAQGLDSADDHVPKVVLLDPAEQDVVLFGRQSYEESLGLFKNRARPTQRKLGYVRLDSPSTDRQISRRHAQIKFSRIHPLVQPPGIEDNEDVPNDSESELSDAHGRRKSGNSSVARTDFESPGSIGPFDGTHEWAWVIRDLDSTNGILVNGVRVQEYPLRHGDIVSFGGANHVSFGTAVLTHKRRPVHSLFVYRFEASQHTLSSHVSLPRAIAGSGNARASYMEAFEGEQSKLSRLIRGFQDVRCMDTSATVQDSSELELLHFFLTYVSVLSCLHPERAFKLTGDENGIVSQRDLDENVQVVLTLYQQAGDSGIPFSQWANWLRAVLVRNV